MSVRHFLYGKINFESNWREMFRFRGLSMSEAKCLLLDLYNEEASWTDLSRQGLFRSYFLIILTYFRLLGANQKSRVFGGMKEEGKEACWIMLTSLTKGLFSAVVALVSRTRAASKSAQHYQFTRLWEAAASHRAQWAPLSVYRWLWRGPGGNNTK